MMQTRSNDGGGPPQVPIHALTMKQRQLVEFIDEYCRCTGEPCSSYYLARRMGVSRQTIQEHLEALYRRGWLLTPNAPVMVRHPTE